MCLVGQLTHRQENVLSGRYLYVEGQHDAALHLMAMVPGAPVRKLSYAQQGRPGSSGKGNGALILKLLTGTATSPRCCSHLRV